ncbi:hypothetical protein Ancab_031104 [Ancistrocladus abbreviatus]
MASISRSKQLFMDSGNIINAWQFWIAKRRRVVDVNPSGNLSNFGKPLIAKDSSFLRSFSRTFIHTVSFLSPNSKLPKVCTASSIPPHLSTINFPMSEGLLIKFQVYLW